MSCIPLKTVIFLWIIYFRWLLPYIMSCRVMVHSQEVGGGGYSRFQVTGMIKGHGLLSKDFLGFEIFDFGVA